MSTTYTIMIQLNEDEYDRLSAEARCRGVDPDTLAHEYVHSSLPTEAEPHGEVVRRTLAALEQLRELTAGLPPVDAVEVSRQSREELERRTLETLGLDKLIDTA